MAVDVMAAKNPPSDPITLMEMCLKERRAMAAEENEMRNLMRKEKDALVLESSSDSEVHLHKAHI